MNEQFQHEMLDRWLDRLEEAIPQQVNGNDEERDRMVEFEYHPNSARITHYQIAPEEESLTMCYLAVEYLVERREAIGMKFMGPVTMTGATLVPVDSDGRLNCAGVSFLDGLIVPDGTGEGS